MSRPTSRLRKTKRLATDQQQQRHQHYQHQSNVNDPLLDRKIEDIASGLAPYYSKCLAKWRYQTKKML